MTLTIYDYQLILKSTFKSVSCVNTFWYQLNGPGNAGQLATAFVTEVLPAIVAVQSADVVYNSIVVNSLFTLEDFFSGSVSTAGTRGNDSLPAFVGWYFQLHRPNRIVHNGRKTFAGVAELDVTDGVATATILALLDTLETVLITPFAVGLLAEAYLSIAETVPYTNPDTGKTYNVPDTLWNVSDVEYKRVSTQNSRKR